MDNLECRFCKQTVVTSNTYSVKIIFRYANQGIITDLQQQDKELVNRPWIKGFNDDQERLERQAASQRMGSGYRDIPAETLEELEIPRCKECKKFHKFQDIWFKLGWIPLIIILGLVGMIWSKWLLGALLGIGFAFLFDVIGIWILQRKNLGRTPMSEMYKFPEVEQRKNIPFKIIK